MSVRRFLANSFLPLLLVFLSACSDPAAKLPKYDKVPEFEMTDSLGHRMYRDALLGKVWIADFIYTSCPAECPRMSSQMHKLAKDLKGENDVRLVSFSVDPARDTPPVLNEFAQHYGGATPQWMFLTGTPESVHLLAYTTFHVGDVIGKIEHSTQFALVDKHGQIRGYYSSFDRDDLMRLRKDIEALRKEKA
ncbi:MAG: SCO family protein [Acidobacteriaceae bacterium]|nr:SCO family protein [Acidobacteriaceae bacterium]